MVLRAPGLPQRFGKGPLVQPIFLTMLYRDQYQMCVVTTVFFMFFYVRRVEPLVLVFRCWASWEIVPMTGTILCVRCVCQLLEPSMIMVYMYPPSLTRYARLLFVLWYEVCQYQWINVVQPSSIVFLMQCSRCDFSYVDGASPTLVQSPVTLSDSDTPGCCFWQQEFFHHSRYGT